jgi:hypothetical protein
MMEASRYLNDYKTIRIGSNYRKLNPDDTLKFHKKSKQFLIEKLEQFKNDKVWVLTHHSDRHINQFIPSIGQKLVLMVLM